MIFAELFGKQLHAVDIEHISTRSNEVLIPIHSTIAKIIQNNSNFKTQSLPESEYRAKFEYGSKSLDVAMLGANNELKGAILFKGIRSEYNKNANNYYEQMKGEASLFIENNIPTYEIIFIPTKIHHIKNGEKTFETPSENMYEYYCNFNINKPSYWDLLKLGVYYFDIDYNTYQCKYAEKKVPLVENNLTEGLLNFIRKVETYG